MGKEGRREKLSTRQEPNPERHKFFGSRGVSSTAELQPLPPEEPTKGKREEGKVLTWQVVQEKDIVREREKRLAS